jgi:hypothetical protein
MKKLTLRLAKRLVEKLMTMGAIPDWMINTLAQGVDECTGGYADGRPCDECQRVAKFPGVQERIFYWRTIEHGLDTGMHP